MRFIHKYGGTSVGDMDRVRAAAKRLAALAAEGHQVVAVVSAQGDMTDLLLSRAGELSRRTAGRELDAYLAAGEQMSAALLAMALWEEGCPAGSLTGWQAGIETDGCHGNARITDIHTQKLEEMLAAGRVAVVAGFQGLSPEGNITTLGRGGSDTTAVALAAWLKADRCEIYTDVDGVYDRDPRKYPEAKKFDRIGYEAMLSLIAEGAQVLHDRSVELAREKGIPIWVRSAFRPGEGTRVG